MCLSDSGPRRLGSQGGQASSESKTFGVCAASARLAEARRGTEMKGASPAALRSQLFALSSNAEYIIGFSSGTAPVQKTLSFARPLILHWPVAVSSHSRQHLARFVQASPLALVWLLRPAGATTPRWLHDSLQEFSIRESPICQKAIACICLVNRNFVEKLELKSLKCWFLETELQTRYNVVLNCIKERQAADLFGLLCFVVKAHRNVCKPVLPAVASYLGGSHHLAEVARIRISLPRP